MDMEAFSREAAENLIRLGRNPYPGRGIVLGRSGDGRSLLQLYWIMGRSANSRNRKFVEEDGRLRTAPLEAGQMERPELVIYTAMDRHGSHHVVTNGDQTDTVVESLRAGHDYRDALRSRAHEPDAPNHTPRIAGGIEADTGRAWLAIVKAQPGDPERSLRYWFEYERLPAGYGWCIHTYAGDGSPLPPFVGEPYPVPLEGGEDEAFERVWGRLDADNRIAIALKRIDPQNGEAVVRIKNKYLPVG